MLAAGCWVLMNMDDMGVGTMGENSVGRQNWRVLLLVLMTCNMCSFGEEMYLAG